MKRFVITCGIGLMFLTLACPKNDLDVTIKLTNPDNQSVAYMGYYKVESSGDSVWVAGDTPGEYSFTADGSGDHVEGMIMKGATDTMELHFQLLVDDEEKLSQSTSSITQGIQFQLDISN